MNEELKNKESFKIPENYFEESKNKILAKTVGEKLHGFDVPNAYFDSLKDSILAETVNKKEKTKVVWLKPLVAVASVAACLLLFVLINPFSTEISEQQNLAVQEILYDEFIEESYDTEEFVQLEDENLYEEYAFLLDIPKEEKTIEINVVNSEDEMEINEKKIIEEKETSTEQSDKVHDSIYELFIEDDSEIEDLELLEEIDEEYEMMFS